jgi:hypothetical protein
MKTFAGVCLVMIPGLIALAEFGLHMALSEYTLQVGGVVWLLYLTVFGTLHLRDEFGGW